jgi:hypothetical protein
MAATKVRNVYRKHLKFDWGIVIPLGFIALAIDLATAVAPQNRWILALISWFLFMCVVFAIALHEATYEEVVIGYVKEDDKVGK